MESTETLMASIDIFNTVMALGIVGLLYAIHDVGKANKILHDENWRERARDWCCTVGANLQTGPEKTIPSAWVDMPIGPAHHLSILCAVKVRALH